MMQWDRTKLLDISVHVYTVSTKRNANFLITFLGVKIIDCKNDLICVVLPFNKELCGKLLS